MTIIHRVLARYAKLGKAVTHDVIAERDIPIPMPDGAVLLADRMYPNVAGGDREPILITRSPYGRDLTARLFAERGYQVLSVRCRGTFGSGGDWQPFFNEEADGKAVLQWLSEQDWFSGSVGTIGGSYVGLTQWVVATDPPPFLKAQACGVTTANFGEVFYPGGVFTLESAATWAHGVDSQEKPWALKLLNMRKTPKAVAKATMTAPLADVDDALVGHRVDFIQEWLADDDTTGPYWSPLNFRHRVERVAPMKLVAGWYDIFVAPQVADYHALREAGRDVSITIGPWTHGTLSGSATVLRDTLEWMDVHLKGKPAKHKEPVRIFVMGAKKWIDLPAWPPLSTPTRWHLQPDEALDVQTPPVSAPDRYKYDPSNPTPGIGGASLLGKNAGPKDNKLLEARKDVLVYSSEVLTQDVSVIGELVADLYVRTSSDFTDFFVRLCDVDKKGVSTNLCDGILRVHPAIGEEQPDGTRRLVIPMLPTANTFKKGHRIRVQVSSGAHPLYARNTGSGEPLGKATTFVTQYQEVFHDPEHPSAIVLPVVDRI